MSFSRNSFITNTKISPLINKPLVEDEAHGGESMKSFGESLMQHSTTADNSHLATNPSPHLLHQHKSPAALETLKKGTQGAVGKFNNLLPKKSD